MKLYEHRQVATVILSGFGATIVSMFVFLSMAEAPPAIAGWVAAVCLVAALLFWSLTVEVTGEKVKVWFGHGLIRKTFPVSEIMGARVARNRWWYGWGIRWTPHGWMFNVSGLEVVELQLRDDRKFRIGSDEPAALVAAIEGVIGPTP